MTECLSDLLQRLTLIEDDRSTIQDFVTRVLLGSENIALSDCLRHAKTATWETQYRITDAGRHAYPDLCLFCDSKPIILVENKIAAGFTEKLLESETQTETVSQLHFYDRWLYKENPDAALVLLTHFTQPPAGFLHHEVAGNGSHPEFQIRFRNSCLWTDVFEWFSKWLNSERARLPEYQCVRTLLGEFLAFLEGQNMAPVSLVAADLGVMDAFFEHDVWNKVKLLLERLRKDVEPLLPSLWGKPQRVPVTYLDAVDKLLWDWAYCFSDRKDLQWYIGWGLAGEDGLKGVHLAMTGASPYVFALLASDKIPVCLNHGAVKLAEEQGFHVWEPIPAYKHYRVLKYTSAEALAGEGKDLGREFQNWVKTAVADLVPVANAAYKELR